MCLCHFQLTSVPLEAFPQLSASHLTCKQPLDFPANKAQLVVPSLDFAPVKQPYYLTGNNQFKVLWRKGWRHALGVVGGEYGSFGFCALAHLILSMQMTERAAGKGAETRNCKRMCCQQHVKVSMPCADVQCGS